MRRTERGTMGAGVDRVERALLGKARNDGAVYALGICRHACADGASAQSRGT